MKILDIKTLSTSKPMALHLTPWFQRTILRYPIWRVYDKDFTWRYVRNEDYRALFGRPPVAFGPDALFRDRASRASPLKKRYNEK